MKGPPFSGSGPLLWALAAGAGIPFMAVLNGALARALGGTAAAVVATCLTGLCASLIVLLLSGPPPTMPQIVGASPLLWCGGLIVAFYLQSVSRLAPVLGATNTILLIMIAQLCTSALIDHCGSFGIPVRRLGFWRIVGLLLVATGFAAMRYAESRD